MDCRVRRDGRLRSESTHRATSHELQLCASKRGLDADVLIGYRVIRPKLRGWPIRQPCKKPLGCVGTVERKLEDSFELLRARQVAIAELLDLCIWVRSERRQNFYNAVRAITDRVGREQTRKAGT